MYMRMITFRLKKDVDQADAMSVYEDMVTILREQNGFKGCGLLFDEEARTAISLTYWADEGCAGDAGERILPLLFERTEDLAEHPPEITGYHVLDHQLGAGHS